MTEAPPLCCPLTSAITATPTNPPPVCFCIGRVRAASFVWLAGLGHQSKDPSRGWPCAGETGYQGGAYYPQQRQLACVLQYLRRQGRQSF